MVWGGVRYIYLKNAQGDITGIRSETDGSVFYYRYDEWGNLSFMTNPTDHSIANAVTYNPLRYRGYVYDQETGFYYLNSRYYNPLIGRFINGDDTVSTGQGLNGNNMFAYCGNNAPIFADPSGTIHLYLGDSSGKTPHLIVKTQPKPKPQPAPANDFVHPRDSSVISEDISSDYYGPYNVVTGVRSGTSLDSTEQGRWQLVLDHTIENGLESSQYGLAYSSGGLSVTLYAYGPTVTYSSGTHFVSFSWTGGVQETVSIYTGETSDGIENGNYVTVSIDNMTKAAGAAIALIGVFSPFAAAAFGSAATAIVK